MSGSLEKVIFICPDSRPGLERVAGDGPLALALYLGKPLLDHALDGLARRGVKEVLMLVSAWPEEIRRFLQGSHTWKLSVRVVTESVEPSPGTAAEKHAAYKAHEVLTLDFLPQAPGVPVLTSLEAWHRSRAELLPLLAPSMIGTQEISPGVWTGLRAQVDPTAVLTAPCWIGPAARVSRRARVQGFVEEGSIVDHDAVVEDSTVGPSTSLGAMTLLKTSLAMGSHLLNWRTGSVTHLTDTFLLAPLTRSPTPSSSIPGRVAALLILLCTWPAVLLLAVVRGGSLFHRALAAPTRQPAGTRIAPQGNPVPYREIASFTTLWRRWPMLWNVVAGEFAWIGNPPLTPQEAGSLEGEFERRWLEAPTGLFTAPEAEGSFPPWDDTAKAHAALFAGCADAAWRRRILIHSLRMLFLGQPGIPSPASAP
ncbi:MAG: Nucleotidyl transferase [Verrucomicrobiales bacterium]|nr:Nucleotidyl transferase [Verrucomicrobiales bacterium]